MAIPLTPRTANATNPRRLPARVEEQYRLSALHLWRLLRERSMPAVVFTSATHGEGTTTTVTEIARHFRDALGLRPLLVQLSAPQNETGNDPLSKDEYARQDLLALSNGQSLPSCVKHGTYSIPTVTRMDPASTSIATTRLQIAIARVLRERQPAYSVVLIDAPAFLESTDTMAICEVVPQVVLVVAAGQTRYEVLARVTSELEEHEISIVGTILNKHKRVIPNWFYRSFVN